MLKDPDKRKRYDALGANWKAGQDFQPPPGWESIFTGAGGPGGFRGQQPRPGAPGGQRVEFDFGGMGGFSDFFESLFGGRGGGGGGGFDFGGMGGRGVHPESRGGETHEATVTISLEDAYHGATREIAFQTVEADERGMQRPTTKTYNVKIPAGISDGGKIRLAGQGGKALNGGTAGDLILTVNIAPHSTYRLNGHDLEVDVPITPWEAVLGAKVQVPTLDGPVTMTIPHGSSAGRRLRLRGKGLPKRRGGERGDLYAVLQIAVPKELTPKEKELFEQLAKVSKFDPRG